MALDVTRHINLLIQQWSESTRLRRLLAGLLRLIQDNLVRPLNDLESERQTRTAQGRFLDWCGERLGFGRPTFRSTSAVYFGFAVPGMANPSDRRSFDQAPFYSASEVLQVREPVGDEIYRRLLVARGRGLISSGSREYLDPILQGLYAGGHARVIERSYPLEGRTSRVPGQGNDGSTADHDGHIYVGSDYSETKERNHPSIYRLSMETGEATEVWPANFTGLSETTGTIRQNSMIDGLEWIASTLYVLFQTVAVTGQYYLYTINLTTGVATQLGQIRPTYGTSSDIRGLARGTTSAGDAALYMMDSDNPYRRYSIRYLSNFSVSPGFLPVLSLGTVTISEGTVPTAFIAYDGGLSYLDRSGDLYRLPTSGVGAGTPVRIASLGSYLMRDQPLIHTGWVWFGVYRRNQFVFFAFHRLSSTPDIGDILIYTYPLPAPLEIIVAYSDIDEINKQIATEHVRRVVPFPAGITVTLRESN